MPRHSYRSGRTSALLLVLLASIAQARASVVVTGTRVIYPGEAREKTVQLSNRDAFPNVVQAWVDIDAPDAPPDQADAPFLVNPAVFRMAPDSGQTLRIVYTGQGLPGDRESLFHLNVLQIPPRNSSHADRNQMLLMLRNRLKLFYRPAGIQGRRGPARATAFRTGPAQRRLGGAGGQPERLLRLVRQRHAQRRPAPLALAQRHAGAAQPCRMAGRNPRSPAAGTRAPARAADQRLRRPYGYPS